MALKKSNLAVAPKPKPEKEEVKTLEPEREIKIEPKFELTVQPADMTPIANAIKEMGKKQEVTVVVEKDKKPKEFEFTVTKRDYRGLIETWTCKEIV